MFEILDDRTRQYLTESNMSADEMIAELTSLVQAASALLRSQGYSLTDALDHANRRVVGDEVFASETVAEAIAKGTPLQLETYRAKNGRWRWKWTLTYADDDVINGHADTDIKAVQNAFRASVKRNRK